MDGMLVSLSMNNFGLFKKANIDFSESFNVITGESGTGKSMFLDSINVFFNRECTPQNLKTTEGSVSAFFYSQQSNQRNCARICTCSREWADIIG